MLSQYFVGPPSKDSSTTPKKDRNMKDIKFDCHIQFMSVRIIFISIHVISYLKCSYNHNLISYVMNLSHSLFASLPPSILKAARAMAEHVKSTSVHPRRWLRQWMLLICMACIASFSSFTGTWVMISTSLFFFLPFFSSQN